MIVIVICLCNICGFVWCIKCCYSLVATLDNIDTGVVLGEDLLEENRSLFL